MSVSDFAASVDIRGNISPLQGSLAKAKGLLSGFVGMSGGMMAAGLGALGLVAGIGATIVAGIKAFAESEAVEKGLAAALKATGNEVEGNMARFNSFASTMQRLTTIDDETTKGLIKQAINLGMSADQAEAYTKAAIGLAAATGTDAASAMNALGKAANGNLTALQRMAPQLTGITDQNQLLTEAGKLGAIGMQEEMAKTDTLSGSFTQCKNAVGDLFEILGKMFAPILRICTANILKLCDHLNVMYEYSGQGAGGMGVLGGAFQTLSDIAWVIIGVIGQVIWVIQNLDLTAEAVSISMCISLVSIWDRMKWLFDNSVVAVEWFGQNWEFAFLDIGNATIAILGNLAKNIKQFFANLWEFVFSDMNVGVFEKGMVPLLEGFESSITQSPKWKEFVPSNLAVELDKELAENSAKWEERSKEWASITGKHTKEAADKAKQDLGKIGGLNALKTKEGKDKKEKTAKGSEIVGLVETWKRMQTAANKEKDEIPKKQLTEAEKQTKLLDEIANAPRIELEE